MFGWGGGGVFCDAAVLRNAGSWTAARLAPAWLLGGNRQPAQLEAAHVISLWAPADISPYIPPCTLSSLPEDQTSLFREL